MIPFNGSPLQLDQLLDLDRCRELLESFQAVTGWPIHLTEPDGNVLVRSDETTASARTRGFNLALTPRGGATVSPSQEVLREESRLESGEEYVLFTCRNGLCEISCPIVVDGTAIATALAGPVFLGSPDEAGMRSRAEEFRWDEAEFLRWLRAVPVRSREEVERVVRFSATLLSPFLGAMLREAGMRVFETRWETLFQKMNSGFARLGVVRDEEGNPRDYRILAYNPAFERLTGISRERVIGRALLEVIPHIDKGWLERFHRIARSGEHEMFVDYSPAFERFYAVDAFCPSADEMVTFVTDVTEIRTLRKLLTRREQLFQAVFGCAPTSIEIYDAEGNLVDANPEFFRIFDIRGGIEDVLGINIFDDPNLSETEKDGIRRGDIVEIEREFDFDLFDRTVDFPTAGKGKRWIGGVFSPLILEEPGKIEGYLGLVQDIGERKRAEISLRDSEERLRVILDAIPDLILHLGRDGRCLSAHYPTDGPEVGHILLDETPGPAVEDIRRQRDFALAKAVEEKAVVVYDHSFLRNDRKVHEEVRVVPLPDDTVLLIVRDVTERIEMQEALRRSDLSLRRSNERLEQIIRENGSIMIVLSRDRKIREFNTTAERVFKRTRADVIGKDYMKLFVREEDMDRIFRESKSVLTGQSLIGHEQDMFDSTGKPLRILWNVVPSRDEEGEVDGFIGSGFDISELMRLETGMQEAQKMEAVGQLAAGVAHDFNNLLHAILGYAEMLGRVKTLEKARHCGEVILEAGRRGSDLVRHLLLFSRKEPFDPVVLDPNTVIMNVLSIAKSALGENVELLYLPDRQPGRVFADAGQLEQVVMNLCINAQHAIGTAAGHVRIAVRQRTLGKQAARELHDLRPGRYVDISVEDDGCGIEEDIRDRIFEPFFTTKEVGQGTGLGLASAYAIAKRHQGSLTVESEVGRGSTFHLWLPVHEEEAVEASRDQPRADEPKSYEQILAGKAILVVEDEEPALRLAESILEAAGCTVLTARDGAEAIERFESHQNQIDAIVLDLVMPRKSGKEVYEAVADRRPGIPVLFCTGYNQDVASTEFLRKISAVVLKKPFTAERLLEHLETLCRNASRGG